MPWDSFSSQGGLYGPSKGNNGEVATGERKACEVLWRKLECDSCQVTPHEPVCSYQRFGPWDIWNKVKML